MQRIIVSYGGGTNSTALLIWMLREGIFPDHVLFADTGGEREGTYKYLSYFDRWLTDNGMPSIEIVKYKTKAGVELTLEQDVLNNNTLPSIAFGWKTCSQKFKILPQERFINQKYPTDEIIHVIGYDIHEERRVRENPLMGHINIFPLVEQGITRDECVKIIKSEGLELPGKSSCFFCPSMKKKEVLALSDEEKKRVISMEKNATKVSELKGLGRQYAWTDLIKADETQTKLFNDIDMFGTPCECID